MLTAISSGVAAEMGSRWGRTCIYFFCCKAVGQQLFPHEMQLISAADDPDVLRPQRQYLPFDDVVAYVASRHDADVIILSDMEIRQVLQIGDDDGFGVGKPFGIGKVFPVIYDDAGKADTG